MRGVALLKSLIRLNYISEAPDLKQFHKQPTLFILLGLESAEPTFKAVLGLICLKLI